MAFWLEYEQDGERREFSFDKPTVSIGRDKGSDFVLDHPTVSRQHALIVSNQGGIQLVVLSRGGLTAIDGQQVSGEVNLYDGSTLNFGQLSFMFRSNDVPGKSANGQAQTASAPSNGGQQAAGGGDGWNAPSWQNDSGQQQGGGFGQQQQGGGFGQQPAQQGGGFGQQPAQGFGPPDGGGGGAGVGDEESAGNGIVSWDDIANSPEARTDSHQAVDGTGAPGTDFERIQAAAKKAEEQSKGTNPVLLGVMILAIVGLGAWQFWPQGKKEVVVPKIDPHKAAYFKWDEGDIDCLGEADCRHQAIQAYKVGKEAYDRKNADIGNLAEAYRQFDKAEQLLKKGKIKKTPKELEKLSQKKEQVGKELETIFRGQRVKFHNFKVRKMYRDMAETLNALEAYFPDKRFLRHQWAVKKERQMKDEGVYPEGF